MMASTRPLLSPPAIGIRKPRRFGSFGTATLSLGCVVLDRPDQSGLYIAKDIACGWAYLVADPEGDSRFRGQGVCEGGLEVALHCAFLSAVARVPECRQIKILVETRQAHQAMAQLAMEDRQIAQAIADRPAVIMTRPLERSSYQVRAAAERAASVALLTRERDERFDAERPDPGPCAAAPPGAPIAARATPAAEVRLKATESPLEAARHRRNRLNVASAPPADDPVSAFAAMRRLVRPLMESARHGLTAAGVISPPRKAPGAPRATADWLNEFESSFAAIDAGLRDMGPSGRRRQPASRRKAARA